MTSKKCLETSKLANLEACKPKEPCLPAINHGNMEEIMETFEATQMSMLCLKCNNYINVTDLQDHRAFHEALSLFQYNVQTKPRHEQALSRQRVALVKDLDSILSVSRSAYRKELIKIDLAYEIIKSEMYGRLHKAKPTRFPCDHVDVTMRSSKAKRHCGISMGVCQSANEKWKSAMEDTYSYEVEYLNDPNSGFFAVYDGYSGETAARKCASQFYDILKKQLAELNTLDELCKKDECQLSACFQQAYDDMDKVLLLGDNEKSRNRWSGCSAATCLLRDRHLHIANVGNVKGVLFQGDGLMQTLTEDHTPSNKKERHRIKSNGDIHKWSKTVWVNGIATTTRGLGNHGDPIFKLSVINTPSVSCVSLNNDDQMILLGSGGFWELFDEEEVGSLIQDWLIERKAKESTCTGIQGNDDNECEKENDPTESFIKISVENEVSNMQAEPSNYHQEVKSEILLSENGPEISDKENHEKHSSYDENESNCNDSNITSLVCGDNQNSLSGVHRKENQLGHDNANVKTNSSRESSPKLCSDMSKRHVPKSLLSSLLEDVTDQDKSIIALEMSKHLVCVALNGGAKDNITVMVVLLHGK